MPEDSAPTPPSAESPAEQVGRAKLPHAHPLVDEPPEANAPAADVAIRYIGSGSLTIQGSVTGDPYSFRGHGAVLMVHAEDAPALLEMERRRQRCCGRGIHVLRYFEPA